jgi:predicted Zn-ribbon and HTH transcriptional regulator
MSISTERLESSGHFATYDPFRVAPHRIAVFTVQCRSCGYAPEDVVTPPRVCPKCHGQAWERFARPGSILENAARY